MLVSDVLVFVSVLLVFVSVVLVLVTVVLVNRFTNKTKFEFKDQEMM